MAVRLNVVFGDFSDIIFAQSFLHDRYLDMPFSVSDAFGGSFG